MTLQGGNTLRITNVTVFCGTRSLMTVFTRTRHWSLPWPGWFRKMEALLYRASDPKFLLVWYVSHFFITAVHVGNTTCDLTHTHTHTYIYILASGPCLVMIPNQQLRQHMELDSFCGSSGPKCFIGTAFYVWQEISMHETYTELSARFKEAAEKTNKIDSVRII
jgi:hypothetical protein